jgi:hypothetical protein
VCVGNDREGMAVQVFVVERLYCVLLVGCTVNIAILVGVIHAYGF